MEADWGRRQSRRLAFASTIAAVAFATVAALLASIRGPGPAELASYPYFSGRWIGIVDVLVVLSAFMTAYATAFLSLRPMRNTALLGLAALAGWAAIFGLTLAIATRVALPGGGVEFIQPDPQSALILVWAISAIAFSPVPLLLTRWRKRSVPADALPRGPGAGFGR